MSSAEVRAGEDAFRGEVVKRDFGPSLDDWFEEGLGHFSLAGDRLHLDARGGGYTAFWKRELPADMLVRYVCCLLPPQGQNNINLISHCRGRVAGQWPMVEGGRYQGYQELANYIVTFVGDFNEETGARDSLGRTRLRRNPGFHLIAEKFEVPSEINRDYQVTFAVQAGRVRYYLDGRKVFDWQDPEPLSGGCFALRTYKTVATYRDFIILALESGR
jgi:hypothetical protein